MILPEPEVITSRDNPRYKFWLQLQTARGIRKQNSAIVAGRRIVPEVTSKLPGQTVIVREGMEPPKGHAAHHIVLSRELFGQLDEFGTDAPLLVTGLPEIGVWEKNVLCGLTVAIAAQDPANLGSILRSALAFGAGAAILLSECAHPFLPRVTRAASGANFRLRLMSGPSINDLEALGFGLDMEGESIFETEMPSDFLLVLGEEGQGLPDAFKGRRLSIPIAPEMESLNVSVAAGIALAAYRQRHPL